MLLKNLITGEEREGEGVSARGEGGHEGEGVKEGEREREGRLSTEAVCGT